MRGVAVLIVLVGCGGPPMLDHAPPVARPPMAPAAPDQREPDPACTANGCLRAVVHVGDYPRAAIEAYVAKGVTLASGYSVDTIEYMTDGAPSRATVATPYGLAAPAGGWHIVANDHGTVGIDDPCAVAGTIGGAALAGTFGARGMIGVAVDYPGLGEPGVHPYLVADVEGKAALDALRATRVLAAYLRVPISGRMAMVGLSQGGHATLAAAALHKAYAPELELRAFAAAGPATVWEEHWRLGLSADGPQVPLIAMMIYAWADHYGYRGPSPWTAKTAAVIDDVMRESCTYPVAGGATIQARLGERADAIFAPDFLRAYRSGSWGAYGAFHDYFTRNRIGPYPQTAPLRIYQGDHDDVVLEAGTDAVVAALEAGGDKVDYQIVPGGTHTDVAFGFVASAERRTADSIAWIEARLAD